MCFPLEGRWRKVFRMSRTRNHGFLLKSTDRKLFLPLQGGGQEGDGVFERILTKNNEIINAKGA